MKSSPDDGCAREGEGHSVNGTQEGIIGANDSHTALEALFRKYL